MKNLIILFVFFSFCFCNRKNTELKNELITKNIKNSKSIIGIVKALEYGKDGYTAKVETADRQIYFVTISHSNLKNPNTYIDFNIDQTIKVTGEFWKMGEENQISVNEIN